MWLMDKWRQYAGTPDERIVADSCKGYRIGYFALISGMCGIAVMLATALFRLIAELVLVGPAHAYWLGNIAVGLFFGIVVFGLCYLAFYCSFRSAKKHREAIAASFLED